MVLIILLKQEDKTRFKYNKDQGNLVCETELLSIIVNISLHLYAVIVCIHNCMEEILNIHEILSTRAKEKNCYIQFYFVH